MCVLAGTVKRANPNLEESLVVSIALYQAFGRRIPVEDKESLVDFVIASLMTPNRQTSLFVQNYTYIKEESVINSPWIDFWCEQGLRHGILMMTDQDTFEFGCSLATWLNTLQF